MECYEEVDIYTEWSKRNALLIEQLLKLLKEGKITDEEYSEIDDLDIGTQKYVKMKELIDKKKLLNTKLIYDI